MIAFRSSRRETVEAYETPGNLANGANVAGFMKVANVMLDKGIV